MTKTSRPLFFVWAAVLCTGSLLVGCNTGAVGESPVGAKGSPAPAPVVETPDPVAELLGKHEAEACKPQLKEGFFVRGECQEGLVCAPEAADISVGSCRVDCARLDGNTVSKDAGKCPAGRSCQIATSLGLKELGAFCLPKQAERDGSCEAVADAEACSGNRICSASSISQGEDGGAVAESFLCRETCAFGAKEGESGCPTDESCVASAYDSVPQLDGSGRPTACKESNCTDGNAKCECKVAEGFACKPYIPGVVAVCEKPQGFCASMVSWAETAHFAGSGFSGELCNEVSDHLFCDTKALKGLSNPAQPSCVRFSDKDDRGFCAAFCSSPALDNNGDGQISDDEKGQKLNCPAEYACSLEFGRELGFVKALEDKKDPSGNKSCDASKCQAGKACPEQCGAGDAECLTFDTQAGGKVSVCAAPIGTCQPK